MVLHARLSKLFNRMALQMTILKGFGNLHISLKCKGVLSLLGIRLWNEIPCHMRVLPKKKNS